MSMCGFIVTLCRGNVCMWRRVQGPRLREIMASLKASRGTAVPAFQFVR
jgi:hypothetical protein